MFKISFSNIFIMDANFAGLCENVNNFSMDGIFASAVGLGPVLQHVVGFFNHNVGTEDPFNGWI